MVTVGSVSLKTGDLSLLVIAILQIVSKDSRLEDFVWRVALVCVWVGEAGRRRTFRNQGLAEGSKIMEAEPGNGVSGSPAPLSLVLSQVPPGEQNCFTMHFWPK